MLSTTRRCLQQDTLLSRVHGRASLALEGLCKVIRVQDNTVDTPFLGRVVVVVQHLDGFLGCHISAVCACVLDEEQLFGSVAFQPRERFVVVPEKK